MNSRDNRQTSSLNLNYTDEKTLAYYQGPALREGDDVISNRLLKKLREHTAPGAKELGVLIDRETGKVKQMVATSRKSVRFDRVIQESVDDLVVVHTHNLDDAFSGKDWDAFVVADNVNLDLLVTPEAIYVLRKTPDFDYLPERLGNESPQDYWERRRAQIRVLGAPDSQAIDRVNQELAEMHGVEYERIAR